MQPFKDLHVYQATAHPRKVYTGMRILVVLASVLVLFQLTHIFNTPVVHAYSCGDLYVNHCYGEWYWPGAMQGEKTDIKVEHINCGCNGFLNDELWVQSSSGCSPNCWVEAGIKNETGYGYTFSFWADQRPNGGGFHNHYMNAFLQGDFDHDTTFFIFEDGNKNEFEVAKAIAGVNGCTQFCSNGWVMYSTSNSMSPNYITLGAELAGSSGASSPNIHFTYNYYYTGSWHPQGKGNPGAGPIVNPPLHAYWVNNQIGGPTGGDWYTYCC